MTPSPETKQIHQKRNPQLTLVQVTLSWLLLPFTSTIFLPTIPLLHLCNITSGYQRKTDAIKKSYQYINLGEWNFGVDRGQVIISVTPMDDLKMVQLLEFYLCCQTSRHVKGNVTFS